MDEPDAGVLHIGSLSRRRRVRDLDLPMGGRRSGLGQSIPATGKRSSSKMGSSEEKEERGVLRSASLLSGLSFEKRFSVLSGASILGAESNDTSKSDCGRCSSEDPPKRSSCAFVANTRSVKTLNVDLRNIGEERMLGSFKEMIVFIASPKTFKRG